MAKAEKIFSNVDKKTGNNSSVMRNIPIMLTDDFSSKFILNRV